jgi:undecaprenyl-diphosphatase
MQEYLEAIFLGVLQGLTEFLPVSSSGHLEIAKYIFGENAVAEESLLMTVVLHFATALSTIIVFWREVKELIVGFFDPKDNVSRSFVFFIVISMIPAGLVGVFAEDFINSLFSDNLFLVSSMLMVTGILLLFANRSKSTSKPLSYLRSFVIGISQAIAILPGISRSGATIATSLLMGIDREKAARFSFLMVVPLIFGKIILDIADGDFSRLNYDKVELILGFFAALISGFLACRWMISIVKRAKLWWFAIYCMIVSLIGITYVFSS